MTIGKMGFNYHERRPSEKFLIEAFSPGTKVVFGRFGQRVMEGVISNIEGYVAVVDYKYLGEIKQAKVRLQTLGKLNPNLLKKK